MYTLFWNFCWVITGHMVCTEKNSKLYWSTHRSVLLSWHFVMTISSSTSHLYHIMVYGSNVLKIWQQNSCFPKKVWKTSWSYHEDGMQHGKLGCNRMMLTWIMATMSRNIVAVFRRSHGKITAGSWHGSCVFAARLMSKNCSWKFRGNIFARSGEKIFGLWPSKIPFTWKCDQGCFVNEISTKLCFNTDVTVVVCKNEAKIDA